MSFSQTEEDKMSGETGAAGQLSARVQVVLEKLLLGISRIPGAKRDVELMERVVDANELLRELEAVPQSERPEVIGARPLCQIATQPESSIAPTSITVRADGYTWPQPPPSLRPPPTYSPVMHTRMRWQ